MPEQQSGKTGWMKFVPLVVTVVTLVFWTGYSFSIQQASAQDITELQIHYEKLSKVVEKIPVIEANIEHISESQAKTEQVQMAMQREQVIMIKALSRIEAKI